MRNPPAFRVRRSKLGPAVVLWTVLMALPFAALPARAQGTAGGQGVYRLAPGDRITVTVFGQPDLSGDFLIDTAGSISLPLIGAVQVSNQSLPEIEHRVTERLADGYLRRPSVSARIMELRPIYVVGNVKAPGSYPFRSGMSVMSAIALGGGTGTAKPLDSVAIADFLTSEERTSTLEATRRGLLVKQARLEAQNKGTRSFDPPAIEDSDGNLAAIVASEREVMDLQVKAQDRQLEILRAQIPLMWREMDALRGQAVAEKRQLEMIQLRLDDNYKLMSKDLAVRSTVLAMEREKANSQVNLSKYQADAAHLEQTMGTIDIRILEVQNLYHQRVMAELQETRTKLQEIESMLPTARETRSVKLNQVSDSDESDNDADRSIVVVRTSGRRVEMLPATEATLLEPGDVVRIARLPGTSRFSAGMPARGVRQPGPSQAATSQRIN
ncbi:MAG: polysaccharide biosynthesis/export family protein [Alphaproteobacteria bacterium]|nr:polysaccharide biosynthesis/export family protein [Alphaproteobacteria bacterium]